MLTKKHLIIVADDNPVDVKRYKQSLTKANGLGITFHDASTGDEVVTLLGRLIEKDEFPSLILLDFMLGTDNAIKVAEIIREKFLPVPLVVIGTELNSGENIAKLARIGANAYMAKPYSLFDFDSCMSSISSVWLASPQPHWAHRAKQMSSSGRRVDDAGGAV